MSSMTDLPPLETSGMLGRLRPDQERKLHELRVLTFERLVIRDEPVELSDRERAWAESTDSYPSTFASFPLSCSLPPRTQSARFHHFCLFEEPDAALLRFLRARKWNVQAAFTSLAAAIAWQSNVGLAELLFHGDSALTQDLHLQKGTSLARGQDRLGRPVIFVHTCLHSSNDIPTHADRERFLVLFIESIRMFLRKPIVKIVIVFDLTGFSMANMDMPGIRMLISTLQSYYPECLAYLVAYGVPWMFTGLWKVISKLMDPFVVAKVRFLNKPNEIQKLIEPKYLPEHMAAVEEEEGKYGDSDCDGYDEASEDESESESEDAAVDEGYDADCEAETDWKYSYKYVPPSPRQVPAQVEMTAELEYVLNRRTKSIAEFERLTVELDKLYAKFYAYQDGSEDTEELRRQIDSVAAEREAIMPVYVSTAEQLLKFTRAPTLYERIGVLDSERNVHWRSMYTRKD